MKREKTNENRSRLIKEMISEYHIESIKDLNETLKEMFSGTIEDMLMGELDAHLGYEKNSHEEKITTNRRNGKYPKTIKSGYGDFAIDIPRDRQGEYEPQLIPTGSNDVSGLEEKVISMYAKGLSDRDISDTVDEIYGFRMSHETISRVVDRIQPRLLEWQTRQLNKCYAFVYLDALMVSVKSEGKAVKKAVYVALGIDPDGHKDVLGFWISDTEGTHFWLSIFDELKSRGVKKLNFVCIDGLSGLEEAIKSTFPEAVVQRCMVHLIRNSTKYIPTKNRKAFCADLKSIYGAPSLPAAELALEQLNQKWNNYPSGLKVWNSNFEHVKQLFDVCSEVRKMIYTTNMIESINAALRKVTNGKGAFPNDLAVAKILYLRIFDLSQKWSAPISNWGIIRGKLDIFSPGWDLSP